MDLAVVLSFVLLIASCYGVNFDVSCVCGLSWKKANLHGHDRYYEYVISAPRIK